MGGEEKEVEVRNEMLFAKICFSFFIHTQRATRNRKLRLQSFSCPPLPFSATGFYLLHSHLPPPSPPSPPLTLSTSTKNLPIFASFFERRKHGEEEG